MKTPIIKGLCLAVALFGMLITSVSAQLSSVLIDNELVCSDPTTVYPGVANLLEPLPGGNISSAERPYPGGSASVDVLAANVYGALQGGIKAVDWVQIELRTGTNADAAAAAAAAGMPIAALLLTDGRVAEPIQTVNGPVVDGINMEPPDNVNLDNQDVYVVVRHRNHVSIMSATNVNDAINDETEYNFTDSAAKAYLSGTKAVTTNQGQSVFVMRVGDGNVDGQVGATQDGLNVTVPLLGTSGYHNADYNMDQQIGLTADMINTLFPNSGEGSPVSGTGFVDPRLISTSEISSDAEVVCFKQQ